MEQKILNRIIASIESVQFGSVDIVIQDSKVVQIEIREKVRFDHQGLRKTECGDKIRSGVA